MISKLEKDDGAAAHIGSFKLSLTNALRNQLATAMGRLTPVPLTEANVGIVADVPGVYELSQADRPVYIGKADKRLGHRLSQHLVKLEGRSGMNVSEMAFKALYIEEDLSVFSPEALLIQARREAGEPFWNTNGFGNNDPGRRRDTSEVGPSHFDALYPIDLSRPVTIEVPNGSLPFAQLRAQVSKAAPYTIRVDEAFSGNPYHAASTTQQQTVAEWMATLLDLSTDKDFVAVALPGRIIVYRSAPSNYPARMAHLRRGDTAWSYNPDRTYPTPKSVLDTGDRTALNDGE